MTSREKIQVICVISLAFAYLCMTCVDNGHCMFRLQLLVGSEKWGEWVSPILFEDFSVALVCENESRVCARNFF